MPGRENDTRAAGLPPVELCATDRAVLGVLVSQQGRVVSRNTILRMAGIDHVGPRRCDSAIVSIRRALGPDSVITVRRRGWMLTPGAAQRAATLPGIAAGASPTA